MKKVTFTLAIAALAFTASCNNNSKPEVVTTDVETVKGENVADAQDDLNENAEDAQEEINKAQKELDEAKAKGDQVLVDAAQKKLDDLKMQVKNIQANAGKEIRSTDGDMKGANKVLNGKTEAAEQQLEKVEETAKEVKKKVD